MEVIYNEGMMCPVEIASGGRAICIKLDDAKKLRDDLAWVIKQAEEESTLSEFEKACIQLYMDGYNDGKCLCKMLSCEILKESAAELLALAREELKKNNMALIDKDQVRAEIERRLSNIVTGLDFTAEIELKGLLAFLDTLPEQPVEGLEDEIHEYNKERFDEYFPEQDGDIFSEVDFMNCLDKVARHFAEWGAEQKAIEIFKKQNCRGCGTQRCTGDGEWLEGCREFQKWKAEYLKQ